MMQDVIDNMIFPSLYTGFMFAFIGAILYSAPPTEINGIIGYRTSSSMKSQERWDFAQKYSSKIMMINGVVMIVFSALGYFIPNEFEFKQEIGIGLLIACVIILIALTEIALKRRFKNK